MEYRLIHVGLVVLATTVCCLAWDEKWGTLIGGRDEQKDTPADADPDNKISNGRVAAPHPYQVQLLSNGRFICSGSILNDHWILTAAHCVKPFGGFQIITGTKRYMDDHDGKLYDTDFSTYHHAYDETRLVNDIALIRTVEPIQFSANVQPVQLSEASEVDEGKMATIAGWGGTERGDSSQVMMETNLKIIGLQQCRKYWDTVDNTHICTLSAVKDSTVCPGDSGGPLTLGDIQIGVTSFGTQGCPMIAGYPNVFTRVGEFKNWINSQIYSHSQKRGGGNSSGGYRPPIQSEYPDKPGRIPPIRGGNYPGSSSDYPNHGGYDDSNWGTGGRYIPGFGFFAERPSYGSPKDDAEGEPEIVERRA